MTRALAAVLFVAATASAASAGTYFGLGLGTGADVNADSHVNSIQGTGRTGRAFGGYRFGRLSVEGAASRYGLMLDGAPFAATQLAVAAKYSFPLSQGFELFGRGGIHHTWLSASAQGQSSAEGTGVVFGGGVEYRFHLNFVAGGSVFLDFERSQTPTFTNSQGASWSGGADTFTLGVMLSL
jgi:hypothetical protein